MQGLAVGEARYVIRRTARRNIRNRCTTHGIENFIWILLNISCWLWQEGLYLAWQASFHIESVVYG